ncbi:hypothetical protein CASFOL_031607 [Castilleja foliolosa]|uniref:F-box domain-containing protein n=1 Tax=Castilleja foliolosa TaxID=1961234 RepID=A0ABD3C6J5_9LAMI
MEDWEDEPVPSLSEKDNKRKCNWDDEDLDDNDMKDSSEEEEDEPAPAPKTEPMPTEKAPKKTAAETAEKKWKMFEALKLAPLDPVEEKLCQQRLVEEADYKSEKKWKMFEALKLAPLDPVEEKLCQQRLVEEADYKSTAELFGKMGDEKTLDNFIPKSESDFTEYAELVAHKLRRYEKSYYYIGLLKAAMRLSMVSLKGSDAKDVAVSITAIANEKIKLEKEVYALEKNTVRMSLFQVFLRTKKNNKRKSNWDDEDLYDNDVKGSSAEEEEPAPAPKTEPMPTEKASKKTAIAKTVGKKGEIVSSITAIANEKIKVEKEANAGKKTEAVGNTNSYQNDEQAEVEQGDNPSIQWLLEDKVIKKVLEEMILVRLPAEDLARYKLVCKDWLDLIESHDFVSAHLNRSKCDPSRHHILFKGDALHPFKSAIRFYSPYVIIVGSINGLICFAGKGTTKYVESPDDIWILNPITGNAIDLPFPDSPVDVTGFDSVTLAFWCDSVTGGYKVVKITSKCDPDSKTYSISYRPVVSNSVELWDSSYPDIWSTIPMGFDRPFHHARAYGWVTRCDAVIGMHCYWIMSYSKGLGAFVLSLNMKTQVLEQIALPDISIPDKTLHEYLADDYKANFFGANWNGNFALVGKGKSCAGIHYYNVWILDICGVWSEKFCFHLDFRIHRFINCIDETLVLQQIGGELVFYYTVNQKCFLLGKKGFYERETPSEGEMAIVDHELFNIWLKLVAAGCSDSAEDYPCSFNDFQISFQDMDIRNSDDEIDNDLAHTFAESVDDFVGSLLTIDKFEPFIPEDQEFMFIRPSA